MRVTAQQAPQTQRTAHATPKIVKIVTGHVLCGYTHMHFDINYVGSRCLGFDVGIHTTDGHTADGHTADGCHTADARRQLQVVMGT